MLPLNVIKSTNVYFVLTKALRRPITPIAVELANPTGHALALITAVAVVFAHGAVVGDIGGAGEGTVKRWRQ